MNEIGQWWSPLDCVMPNGEWHICNNNGSRCMKGTMNIVQDPMLDFQQAHKRVEQWAGCCFGKLCPCCQWQTVSMLSLSYFMFIVCLMKTPWGRNFAQLYIFYWSRTFTKNIHRYRFNIQGCIVRSNHLALLFPRYRNLNTERNALDRCMFYIIYRNSEYFHV